MKKFRSIESIRNEAAFQDDERQADKARGEFLTALLAKFATDSFTPYEAYLLATWHQYGKPEFMWTGVRRELCDRMMKKYRRGVR